MVQLVPRCGVVALTRGGAVVVGPGAVAKSARGMTGRYLHKNVLLRSVTQPEPSTLTTYPVLVKLADLNHTPSLVLFVGIGVSLVQDADTIPNHKRGQGACVLSETFSSAHVAVA